ncbi:molecular chaperone TorD family protein [Sulfolobaceae archaeon RB850M]
MSFSLEISSLRFLMYDLFSTLFFYNYYDEDYERMIKKLDKLAETEIDAVNVKRIRDKIKSSKKSDLLIEYTTLFMTGIGIKPLIPVESKRFFSLMGERVAQFRYNDILRFYKSRNVKINYMLGEFTPEPDHISTILAFMSLLIKEEIDLKRKGEGGDLFKNKSDQKNFFTTHVYSWIPDWANDVISDKRSDIYRVVCEELRKWIENEREYLLGDTN